MDITTVAIFIKQVISTLLILLMMISPVSFTQGTAYEAAEPEELVMSFAAVSDIHVETNNPEAYKNFSDLLYGIKAGKHHEATVFLGDNVMNGQYLEDFFFYSAVRTVSPGNLNFVAMGNHDVGNGEGDYYKLEKNFIACNNAYLGAGIEEMYYYKVVNGCYMIFLASEDENASEYHMSDEQIAWFKGVLDEAAAADAPIIVFNHFPIYYFKSGANDTIAKLLRNYENVLFIHGHIHNDLGTDNFYNWGGINCINLPRATEITEYEPGDGIVVEIYEDEILVRGRDFIKGEWIEELEYHYPVK